MSDFAGNAATGSLEFTTRAPPPLVAADGFESVTDTMLGGAQVLSGAGAPIISGARSLYVPPGNTIGPGAPTTQMALRLAVAPGSKMVRFAYRAVNPGASQAPYFSLASVGGSLTFGTPIVNNTSGTAPAMIGQAQVTLGPLMAGEILLPADVTDEIVLARIAPRAYCGSPALQPLPGIIIDDLRVE
jgi:hypothetical protein